MNTAHKLLIDNMYPVSYTQYMQIHDSQRKLLKFLKGVEDLEGLSYWEIARETGLKNAQNVIHHLGQLEKLGYLRRDLTNPTCFEVLKDPIEDVVYLNLHGFAQCGNKSDFFSENNTRDKIAISTKLFGISNAEKCFLIKAKGDSMEPEITENDLIIFEAKDTAEDSYTALVSHAGECKIKQIFHLKDGTLLKSWNKKHADITVKRKEDVVILGIAKHIIKSF